MTERNAWGVDVSAWKGAINWTSVRDAGATFAIAKCTDGFGYVDSQWANNYAGIKAAGLARGGFHYFQATDDPVRQATEYLQHLQLTAGDLPPIIDLEEPNDLNYPDGVQNFNKFLETVEFISKIKPIIYTGVSYWREFHKFVPPIWDGVYELWLALPGDGLKPMQLPDGWANWRLWQCSWTGRVAGIQNGEGDVDMNWYNGTPADLKKWLAEVNPTWGQRVSQMFNSGKIADAIFELQEKNNGSL